MKAAYWDALADNFARDVFEITERDVDGVIAQTARRLGGPRRVAGDFGCGAGASSRAVAPYFGAVRAVDFSSRLLAAARAAPGPDNIRYRKADLTRAAPARLRCDVGFCFNVLITPDAAARAAMVRTIVGAIAPGGAGVFIAPSLESELRAFQIVLECRRRAGDAAARAAQAVDRSAAREIVSLSQGLVTLGGAPTKHFLEDELCELLENAGLRDVRTRRVSFAWDAVLDDAPADLDRRLPWDWMAEGKKP